MKLHVRLALPVFAIATAATLAGIAGVVILVGRTAGAALDQDRRQFARIVDHALLTRTRELSEVATILATLTGPLPSRLREWHHVPVDAAALVDLRANRLRGATRRPPTEDSWILAARARRDRPVLLDDGESLLLASVEERPDHGEAAVVCRSLSTAFLDEIGGLLQCDAELLVAGRRSAGTSSPLPGRRYRVEVPLATLSGVPAMLSLLVPAGEFLDARTSALRWAVGGGLLLLAAALGFYGYTVLRVTRPIRDLTAAVDRLAGGDPVFALPDEAPAELGTLVRQFASLATRLQESQRRLIHSAKLASVGTLVAGVSHELNNPLAAVLTHAEYLATRLAPDAPGREELDTLMAEGQRMKRILGELRGFLRVEDAARTTLDLRDAARNVLGLIRHDAQRLRVEAGLSVPESPVTVVASSDQIRQVLLNLVLNALQAMPDGGRLEVTVTRNGGTSARVLVADSGAGIPAADLGRVTEPFFSTKPGRLGLGLAISRDLVERHGGRLTLERGIDRGTRAIVDLPVSDP